MSNDPSGGKNHSGKLPDGQVPRSPAELLALQRTHPQADQQERSDKPKNKPSVKAHQVQKVIQRLDLNPAEIQHVALHLLRRLENLHDDVTEKHRTNPKGSRDQLMRWAVDADRLMWARVMVENVDLEG